MRETTVPSFSSAVMDLNGRMEGCGRPPLRDIMSSLPLNWLTRDLLVVVEGREKRVVCEKEWWVDGWKCGVLE